MRPMVEPYEGMLIRLENPTPGGRVSVINPNIGFGEYRVGLDTSLSGDGVRILAGRQSGTSAQSSLDVSYISDMLLMEQD